MSTLNLENIKHPDSASNNVSVTSTGRTGVGTGTPSATFHVEGGSNNQMRVSSTGAEANLTLDGGSYAQINNTTGTLYVTNNTASDIEMRTASTTRLKVDGSGRVTMPYQPMVHVAKNNGAFTASSGVWIGNRNDVNVGGHYNNSTGVFTAPVTGLYYFSFFILAQANHNFDLGIRKNGSQYSESDFRCNNGAVSHNFTLSGSVLMNLAQNDTADLYVTSNPGGTIYGNGLNGIQIMLVG